MARDLIPRTIELTLSQNAALTAISHRERRSVSWLVREAVEGYIAAYKQAHGLGEAPPPRPDLRTMGISPSQQKYAKPPSDSAEAWLSSDVNLQVDPSKDSIEKTDEKPEPEDSKK